MPRRVPLRLARLLAVACACLVPAAVAQAQPPNDAISSPTVAPTMTWTSLSLFSSVILQAADWGDATTGPEDVNPLPSCNPSPSFRSVWYSVSVPEAAVLRVTVASTNNARYQPLVTILDSTPSEVACGLASTVVAGATATATAYVTPNADGTAATYLIRVANALNSTPSGGLPTVTVAFAGRDVTPPHIKVIFPSGKVPPGVSETYDASQSYDYASGLNGSIARWEFYDSKNDAQAPHTRTGLKTSYTWKTPGTHKVVFTLQDNAGNQNMYRFATLVQDTTPPQVSFTVVPPDPGAGRVRIKLKSSETAYVRLLVTQVGHRGSLVKRSLIFWGNATHSRSIRVHGKVGTGLIVYSGIARDKAGNATELPQCVVDPVSGQGSCNSP
jgi:hypothetical protein